MSKIILVSGGNRGIGNEICNVLSRHGHTVYMGARKPDRIDQEKMNSNGEVLKLDVTLMDDIKNAVVRIKERFGRLDVLINNAGIGIGSKGALVADLSEVRTIMDTNFFGTWQLTQECLPLLQKSDEGRIINMSSGMGALNDLVGGYAGYRLSKTAMNGLTILMANELKNSDIRVNAMCPGWVRTNMGGEGAPRSVEEGADTAVWLAEADNIPNGKFLRDRKVIPW